MPAVEQMTYRRDRESAAAVEVMTFARLRRLNDGGTQRADFHVLAIVASGTGSVFVDFEHHVLNRRTVAWIRPGAVHRWDDTARLTGHLVLFVPTAPVTDATRELVATPGRLAPWRVPAAEWGLVSTAVEHLRLEADAAPAHGPSEIAPLLLSALVARLRPPDVDAHPVDDVFGAFRSAVETHFREHHDVGYYAAELGYAPRTLSRAVQRRTGTTAKTFITERLVLEAKRLLVHDRLTAARCAAQLGFADAANFSAFFLHATGQRPGAWQRRS